MKKDLVIGIVGAAILVAAMVGVFRYEAARAGSSFNVTWGESTLAGPSVDGTTAEGGETQDVLNITQTNLTALTFQLTWTDDVAQSGPDEFELTVITPEGESQTVTGAEGSLSLTFGNLSSTPAPRTVTGSDESAAHATLASSTTSTIGTGTWSFVVKLVDAGDQAAPVVGAAITQDTGNPWTLSVEQTVYTAQLAR